MKDTMQRSYELNLDGLIGPTHNYSGLSYGNVASMEHEQLASNPKKAALEGLNKMRTLASLGLKQGILPPHERPFFPILRTLGYYGTDQEVLEKVLKSNPALLKECSSSACMWAANAATVSPSADSYDKRVHFTPANLLSKFHRSFEAMPTGMILHRIFNHQAYFAHHYPLPFHANYADEGAANHTRFCQEFDQPGIQLFVYGRRIDDDPQGASPKKFPARQTDEAAKTMARLHRLNPDRVVFAQQNPEAIDAGVFHNDVISVGHQNVFLYHEKAFINTSEVISQLKKQFEEHCQAPFIAIEVKDSTVSLGEAVKTYLFNSQIVTLPDRTMALIAPKECQESASVRPFLEQLVQDTSQPIRQVVYQDLRQSMQNGGGPACLRLRVALTKTEFEAMNPSILLTDDLYNELVRWVEAHYRDHLVPADLADPNLLIESRQALDELTHILQLGPIYPFQQVNRAPPPPLPERRT